MSRNDKAINAGINVQREIPIYKAMEQVKDSIEIQLEGEKISIPTLCGRPGIAKTAHIADLAESMNMRLLYCSMNKPYEFFTGLPESKKVDGETAEEQLRSFVFWSKPELIKFANDYSEDPNYKGCIIFLDDIHIMTEDVQKVFYEFVLERKLGMHRLNDNIAITAAMNSEEISGFDGFMSPINNRLQKIKTMLPFDYWYRNCGAGLNLLIASYLRNNKDACEEPENTTEAFATYRSWSMLSLMVDKVYNRYMNNKSDALLSNSEKADLANDVFDRAATFISVKNALNLKENIIMQLRYDFETMVKKNKYNIDHEDAFAALAFGNVTRFIHTEKEIEQLIVFLREVSSTLNYNSYKNTIINIMLELVALLNFTQNKYEKDRENNELKAKLKFYNVFIRKMFNNVSDNTKDIVNEFLNQ